jgi:hypothetical protein
VSADRSRRLLRVVFTMSLAVVASGATAFLAHWGGLNGPQALITALSSFGGVTSFGLNLVDYLAGHRVPAFEPQGHGHGCARSCRAGRPFAPGGTSTRERRSKPASGRSPERFDPYPIVVVVVDIVGRGQAEGLRLPRLQVPHRRSDAPDDDEHSLGGPVRPDGTLCDGYRRPPDRPDLCQGRLTRSSPAIIGTERTEIRPQLARQRRSDLVQEVHGFLEERVCGRVIAGGPGDLAQAVQG